MSKIMKTILAVVGVFVFCAVMGMMFGKDDTVGQNNNNEKVSGETSFKVICEENAKQHPAKAGAILYTKGDHDFTGMEYYFKGEVIKFDTIETNIGTPNVWLVKNENGYVMPIQHEYYKASIGDKVEVWGNLSGNGFANAEGIDNVVGQTGSIHAMQVAVNGVEQ